MKILIYSKHLKFYIYKSILSIRISVILTHVEQSVVVVEFSICRLSKCSQGLRKINKNKNFSVLVIVELFMYRFNHSRSLQFVDLNFV